MRQLDNNTIAAISGGDRACRQARRALRDAAEDGASQVQIDMLIDDWMEACDII